MYVNTNTNQVVSVELRPLRSHESTSGSKSVKVVLVGL